MFFPREVGKLIENEVVEEEGHYLMTRKVHYWSLQMLRVDIFHLALSQVLQLHK